VPWRRKRGWSYTYNFLLRPTYEIPSGQIHPPAALTQSVTPYSLNKVGRWAPGSAREPLRGNKLVRFEVFTVVTKKNGAF
jgi:hypothetical protein